MYEHRLYIVNRRVNKMPNGKTFIHSQVIAMYECAGMPYDFYGLFKAGNEIDFSLYEVGCDADRNECIVETMTDCYGEHCKMVKPGLVVKYLENAMKRENYRRFKPLLGLLNGFDESEWDDLEVVNYGH